MPRPRDHELEFKEDDYGGFPKKEILRIDATGTKIALEALDMLEEDREHFKDDLEMRSFIETRLVRELGPDLRSHGNDPRFSYAWHETCNPLGIWRAYSLNRGLSDEELEFERSKTRSGLELIKTRSLDCRGGMYRLERQSL